MKGFSILSWNCFGMGQSALDAITYKRAPHGERFRESRIVTECANAEILCLQEILSYDAQKFFDKLARKHFIAHTRDHNRLGFSTLRGSGLGIATKYHILRRHLYYFKNKGLSWDRLARKGILFTRLQVEDQAEFDVFSVHLQSGFDEKSTRSRMGQLAELQEQILRWNAGKNDCVVCGDFNIDGTAHARTAEYAALSYSLDGFTDLALHSDEPTFHPTPDGNLLAHRYEPGGIIRRIDYIFFREGFQRGRIIPDSCGLALEKPVLTGKKKKFLWPSDHFAVRANFKFV